MIRFRLRERLADEQFRTGKRITLAQIEEATGINKTTLSKISTRRGYNTTTSVLDALCRYFDCRLDQLAEYVPDEELE